MQNITVWGQAGSSSLVTKEDFFSYSLQVEWLKYDRWRCSMVTLPSGEGVLLYQFVAANFKHPRPHHPEYALAIELLLANAVVEAKVRGFRVASVELGVWAYRTLTTLGKRVTKVGLPEPILLEDGRTLSRVGYIWVDHNQEGVALRPWANGDQLIRLVDDQGHYYVPVDERTGDAESFKAQSWRAVKQYPTLDYAHGYEWADVPLLDDGDQMELREACGRCLELVPLGSLVRDRLAGKSVCAKCVHELGRARNEAHLQGWDFDKGRPLPGVPQLSAAALKCAHKWGLQICGVEGELSPGKIRHECILCGEPAPEGLKE
jgi:hypothetical protein